MLYGVFLSFEPPPTVNNPLEFFQYSLPTLDYVCIFVVYRPKTSNSETCYHSEVGVDSQRLEIPFAQRLKMKTIPSRVEPRDKIEWSRCTVACGIYLKFVCLMRYLPSTVARKLTLWVTSNSTISLVIQPDWSLYHPNSLKLRQSSMKFRV